jgi:hypothetical protein
MQPQQPAARRLARTCSSCVTTWTSRASTPSPQSIRCARSTCTWSSRSGTCEVTLKRCSATQVRVAAGLHGSEREIAGRTASHARGSSSEVIQHAGPSRPSFSTPVGSHPPEHAVGVRPSRLSLANCIAGMMPIVSTSQHNARAAACNSTSRDFARVGTTTAKSLQAAYSIARAESFEAAVDNMRQSLERLTGTLDQAGRASPIVQEHVNTELFPQTASAQPHNDTLQRPPWTADSQGGCHFHHALAAHTVATAAQTPQLAHAPSVLQQTLPSFHTVQGGCSDLPTQLGSRTEVQQSLELDRQHLNRAERWHAATQQGNSQSSRQCVVAEDTGRATTARNGRSMRRESHSEAQQAAMTGAAFSAELQRRNKLVEHESFGVRHRCHDSSRDPLIPCTSIPPRQVSRKGDQRESGGPQAADQVWTDTAHQHDLVNAGKVPICGAGSLQPGPGSQQL